MLEVERKLFFRDRSARQIERRLGSAGIVFGPAVRQRDRVFAASRKALLNPVPGTVVARVRLSNPGDASLTVKVRRERDLSRDEVEVGVDDPDAAEAVLIALGQQHIVTVNKLRASARLNGATVTVDDVVGLGVFIEVEILTDDTSANAESQLDRLVETIEQHVGEMGSRVGKGYDRLVLESQDAET